MIRAVIFDLDGTLVRTEELKALSYGRAADELEPGVDHSQAAYDAFAEVVGQPRQPVAEHVMKALGMEELSAAHMAEFGVSEPWEAFVAIRLRHYKVMAADHDLLRENQWLHNVQLVTLAHELGCKVGLATASSRAAAMHVLTAIGLADAFDFIATDDDVVNGKPDPEIYLLVAGALGVEPSQCVVIEDSPSGVKAALVAGAWCIAVSTPFTHDRLHSSKLLEERWIVDDPTTLPEVMRKMFAEREADEI